jgi:hypothetical protein
VSDMPSTVCDMRRNAFGQALYAKAMCLEFFSKAMGVQSTAVLQSRGHFLRTLCDWSSLAYRSAE